MCLFFSLLVLTFIDSAALKYVGKNHKESVCCWSLFSGNVEIKIVGRDMEWSLLKGYNGKFTYGCFFKSQVDEC